MHPIERLRYVARAAGVPQELLVRETAAALSSFGRDPQGLVTACRRMIGRQPSSGPLVWLTARMLTGADPRAEARAAAEEIGEDATPRQLARAIPDDATVTVVGCLDLTAGALERRGDVDVLAVEGGMSDAAPVPASGVGAAVVESDLVILEAPAVGPDMFLAPSGSHAAAAIAQTQAKDVWLVAGVGRLLPRRMWDGLADRALAELDPWDADYEAVPLSLVDRVAGPGGVQPVPEALRRVDCPVCPELFRSAI